MCNTTLRVKTKNAFSRGIKCTSPLLSSLRCGRLSIRMVNTLWPIQNGANLQTTISIASSSIRNNCISKFHWRLFLRVQSMISFRCQKMASRRIEPCYDDYVLRSQLCNVSGPCFNIKIEFKCFTSHLYNGFETPSRSVLRHYSVYLYFHQRFYPLFHMKTLWHGTFSALLELCEGTRSATSRPPW